VSRKTISGPTEPVNQTTKGYQPLTAGLAVLLTICVFAMIWVGSLVTPHGASLPQAYGWTMFRDPPSTWFRGGFDLAVETGYRCLASIAVLISIGLLIVGMLYEQRVWFKWWSGLVLLVVIVQALLGGFRVHMDQPTAAMLHGCFAQLLLAIATGTVVMSSRWWFNAPQSASATICPTSSRLAKSITGLLLVSYLQVVVGAQLRHVTGNTDPSAFMGLVHIHLVLAGLVFLLSLLVAIWTLASRHLIGGVKWPALLILGAVLLQIGLGLATWLVNYALPWQELRADLAGYTIQFMGYWESAVNTAHVVTGAFIIFATSVLCCKAWRSCWTNGLASVATK
jgi:heme a synthase